MVPRQRDPAKRITSDLRAAAANGGPSLCQGTALIEVTRSMAVPHRRGIGSAWEPIPEVPPREPGQPRCSRSVSRSLQRASLRCTRHELGAVAGCNTPAGHPCSDGHPCQFCPAKTLPWTPTIERNLFCKRDATPLEVRFLQAHVPAPAVLFASLLGTRGVACHEHGTALSGSLPGSWDHLDCQSWDHPARLAGGFLVCSFDRSCQRRRHGGLWAWDSGRSA